MVFGGDQFRPLLHVRDAARAIVDNLETATTGIFNLASQNVRIVDLACHVRNHFPDLVVEQTELQFQDARNYRVSSERAGRILGFKPEHSIDDGIEEVKELWPPTGSRTSTTRATRTRSSSRCTTPT